MSAVLPLEAVARTGGNLVARPRASVVHVTAADVVFTPTGRLRTGQRPLCNQPGRPCRRARFDGRALCRRCIRALLTRPGAVRRDQLTEPRLAATVSAARTADELHAAIRLLCLAPPGMTVRLSPLVRDQRRALGMDQPALTPLPDQRLRRHRDRRDQRPAWQRELDQ